ncbi:MAG: hypothetical protein KDD35_07015 [Bdellovibrionales bacterium]|nr:hypothetical protein [Bdellovibrionales bacterium]
MNKDCCLEILVVEDEVGICDMTEYVAQGLGCLVYKAHTASEGLEILKNNPHIRLGIFDYHLSEEPNKTSWSEGLGRSKELLEDFQYFLITGDLKVGLEDVQKYGALQVIHKPVTGEELQNLISDFIKSNRSKICSRKQQKCPNA